MSATELHLDAENARRNGRRLENASAEQILEWAGDAFPRSFVLTSSMGNTALIHLASIVLPGIPVIFLDTGYHFPETLDTLDAVRSAYNIELIVCSPKQTVAQQDALRAPELHQVDPDACCALRKVEPLEAALAPYPAWGSGLRRDESPARRATPVVAWDSRRGKYKVSPFARWTSSEIAKYAQDNRLILNPLLSRGYPSIGCQPCTQPAEPGSDPRSGRWPGRAKNECGIHLA